MNVAILGAPRTGKTELTHALSTHLAQLGLSIDITNSPATNHLGASDRVLLCGLDLQPPSTEQIQADLSIREHLRTSAVPFQVVYGRGPERLHNALYCMGRWLPEWALQLERPEPPQRWFGACDICSDGDCEHRLFSALIKS